MGASSSSSLSLRVAVAGGGPAGLFVAIGLFKLGHHVIVLDKLEHPRKRGTVNRDRSYPVDITARGMKALDAIDALQGDTCAMKKRLLPFYGHRLWEGEKLLSQVQGLIGTRDDIVLALLDHIDDITSVGSDAHGSIQCFWEVAAGGVDLKTKSLKPVDGAEALPEAAQGEFDLIVVSDGKNSLVRDSASKQDHSLVVTPVAGRDGEVLYKTLNFDLIPDRQDGKIKGFEAGWLYAIGGPPPKGVICSRLPSDPEHPKAIGIVPFHDENMPPDMLQQRLPEDVLALVTTEEREAFNSRVVSDAGGGCFCSQLCAGGCMAIVGDAATSPPPPGQGVNHAFEAAHSLIKSVSLASAAAAEVAADAEDAESEGLTKQRVVSQAVEAYNTEQHPNEQAYAFLGAPKTTWQATASMLGTLIGMHPMPGPEIKDSTEPYSELTSMHRYV